MVDLCRYNTYANIRIAMEIKISYHGTVLIAMRVNIAIGEVKGM